MTMVGGILSGGGYDSPRLASLGLCLETLSVCPRSRPAPGEKNARFVDNCAPYQHAVWCWLKMKPICSCSHRCVLAGLVAAKRLRCDYLAGMRDRSFLEP